MHPDTLRSNQEKREEGRSAARRFNISATAFLFSWRHFPSTLLLLGVRGCLYRSTDDSVGRPTTAKAHRIHGTKQSGLAPSSRRNFRNCKLA